jgi:hypothetical protein
MNVIELPDINVSPRKGCLGLVRPRQTPAIPKGTLTRKILKRGRKTRTEIFRDNIIGLSESNANVFVDSLRCLRFCLRRSHFPLDITHAYLVMLLNEVNRERTSIPD